MFEEAEEEEEEEEEEEAAALAAEEAARASLASVAQSEERVDAVTEGLLEEMVREAARMIHVKAAMSATAVRRQEQQQQQQQQQVQMQQQLQVQQQHAAADEAAVDAGEGAADAPPADVLADALFDL
eukprot:3843451-Prymnesium_polylepis.1